MTIQPGDLVMVTKPQPCCGLRVSIGKVFTVAAVEIVEGYCTYCGKEGRHSIVLEKKDANEGLILSRVIKIDPQAIEETASSTEELAA